jgi:hypothetical protein
MSRNRVFYAAVPVLSLVVLPLVGCSPPKGEPTGRADVTDTTPAERASPQVQPTALVEFSDQVVQQLVADMSTLPEFNQEQRVTLIFGDIANKTGIVPTSDFEAFRLRIRKNLMQSSFVRDRVRFVETRARVNEIMRRESADETLPEGGRIERDPLPADSTFVLNGDMYRVERGGHVNLYSMGFTIVGYKVGDIVWESAPYEIKQVR